MNAKLTTGNYFYRVSKQKGDCFHLEKPCGRKVDKQDGNSLAALANKAV
jgi:hypothetical protein